MALQRDAYLRELRKVHKVSASLKEVNKFMTPFSFLVIAGSQVMHLVRIIERKTEVVDSAQKELEFLHGQNASLTQKLKECSSSSIVAVIESFENALQ